MKNSILKILIFITIVSTFLLSGSVVSAEGTSSLVQGDYYSLNFSTNDLTGQRVRINGIHKNLLNNFETNFKNTFCTGKKYMVSPYFIDAEKIDGTSHLCWAASASNMLVYSGWADQVDKSTIDFDTKYDTPFYDIGSEDGVFNYYAENFTNNASNNIGAFSWFFNGTYDVPESENIARPNENSGGLLPNVYYTYLANYFETNGIQSIDYLTKYLDMGAAVCMMMNWRDFDGTEYKSGNHVITIWGYLYDSTKSSTDEGYCLSLLYTDSDDDEVEDYELRADDKLCIMDIRICTETDVSYNPNYLKSTDVGKIISENYSTKNLTMVSSAILTLAPVSVVKDNFTTVVDTTEDVSNIGDGKTSLREAISYAKHTNTPVTFANELNGCTFDLVKRIDIKNNIVIDASALSSRPTIRIKSKPGDEYGIFQLYDTANLEIKNVNFTSALPPNTYISGIYNQGTLSMTNCKIYNMTSDAGGGIYNNGNLTLNDCEIVNNSAIQVAGGIYCAEGSTTTLKGSTVIANNLAKNQTCNLYINNQSLNVDGLTSGANVGIYLNAQKDKEDPEKQMILCDVDPTVANNVFNLLNVDNDTNYSISLNDENDKIIISEVQNGTFGLFNCGNITMNATWFLPLSALFVCLILVTLKRKIFNN